MSQVNIIVKSSVLPQAEFKGTTPEAGMLAIDAEGQQIKDEKIITGIKIGDGNTIWDNLEYLKLAPNTANTWKEIAESATSSQLVSLPDVKLAYVQVNIDQLDNATYNEIVKKVAANEIGLTFSLNDTTMTVVSNDDKPYLTPAEGSFLADASIIDTLTINDASSAHDSFSVKFQDTIAQQQIKTAVETLNTTIARTEAKLNENIEKAAQEIKDSTYSLGDPNTPSGTTSGTILFPDADKATKDFFLSGAGTWEQIILTADKVSYKNGQSVEDALNTLLEGASLNVQAGTSADTKVFVLGINQNELGSSSKQFTLKYSTGVYVDCNTNVLYGGAWNDIAEFRESFDSYAAGYCVYETAQGKLMISDKRMIPNSHIVSDTYGYALGEKDIDTVPVAIAGRVLAYYLDDKNELKIGDAVCSGPNGAVCKMKKWEKILHPECIVGYVSEIPQYEIWGQHHTSVHNRVWIRVK